MGFNEEYQEDNPIKTIDEDILGIEEYTEYLGNVIFNYLSRGSKESLVMGICGEWGSGKTSIINLSLEQVKLKFNEEQLGDYKPIVLNFDPWNFSNQSNLIQQFFSEISIKLENENIPKLKNIGEKLRTYSSKIVPPIAIVSTLINPATAPINNLVTNYVNSLNSDDNIDLYSIKKDIDTLLERQDNKIIIVIDDIDRLTKPEIQQIFQLVKSLGDFSNTLYVLSFDRDIISKSLDDLDIYDGSNYLKKIVPLTLDIPSILEVELRELYMNYMQDFLNQHKLPLGKYSKELIDIYDNFLKNQIKNLRDLKRLMNHIFFFHDLFKNDVYTPDFVVITAIQIFNPELYNIIWRNANIFIKSDDDFDEENLNKQIDEYQKIINNYPTMVNGLNIIFPKTNYLLKGSNVLTHRVMGLPYEVLPTKRIQFEEHFYTYFKFKVPKWEMSQLEFEFILNSLDSLEDFQKAFLDLTKHKQSKFLELLKIHAMPQFDLKDHKIEITFKQLKNVFKFFLLRNNLISEQILDQIKSISEIFVELYDKELVITEKYIKLVDNPSASCNFIVELVELKMISDEEFSRLNEICIDKIIKHLSSQGFKDIKDPLFILNYLEDFDPEKVEKFVDHMKRSDLLILLSSIRHYKNAIKLLKGFFDLDLLKLELKAIINDKASNDSEIAISKSFYSLIEKNSTQEML